MLIDTETNEKIIKIDKRYFRPTEVDSLLGDATKAKKILKWIPEYNLDQLISEMVDRDLEIARRENLD